MDEEVDPGEKNVKSVLEQESSEMFHVLRSQSPTVITELYQSTPSHALKLVDATRSTAAELIEAMMEYLKVASDADCCLFLQSMCILCENIPIRLEARLMSVAGHANYENATHSVTNEENVEPHPEHQLNKRPRIDHWEQYIVAVVNLMLRRWQRLSEGLVKDINLETVWISPRPANRGRDRPEQTPGQTDRGSRTPGPNLFILPLCPARVSSTQSIVRPSLPV